ncbi:MAG: hypothetical protein ACE5KI_06710, partial [Dehalococcoidia bacterium]
MMRLLRRRNNTPPEIQDEMSPLPSEEPQEASSLEPASVPALRAVAQRVMGAVHQIDQLLRRRKVTLSIDKGIIRAVVFRGREVSAWGTIQAEESTAEEGGNG